MLFGLSARKESKGIRKMGVGGAPVPYAYDGKTKKKWASRQAGGGISQMKQAESPEDRWTMDIGAGEDR